VLRAMLDRLAVRGGPERPPPAAAAVSHRFVQRRLREGALEAQTEWVWREGAWRAQGPPAHGRDSLRCVFISDMHGCHGMLDRWFLAHPQIMEEADVLCMCGDSAFGCARRRGG